MADSKAAPAKEAPAAKGKDAAAPGKGAEGAAAADGKAAKKKNPKQVIIIAAAAVLLLLAAAGTYFFFFRGKADAPPEEAAAGAEKKDEKADAADKKDGKEKKDKEKKKSDGKKPFFVEFESFTVNLKDPEKFLQIKITLQVTEADAAEVIKDMMPLIRSAMIPVLSAQDPAELATAEGKEKLSGEIAVATRKALAGTSAEDAIDAALITHMIIQ